MLRLGLCLVAITAIYFVTLPINADQEKTNGCDTFCNLTYVPICGIDDSGKKKNFPNECVMKSENCVHKTNYQRIDDGTCP